MKTLDDHLKESEDAARQQEADEKEAREMLKDPEQVEMLVRDYEPEIWEALTKAMNAPCSVGPLSIRPGPDMVQYIDTIRGLLMDVALYEINWRRKY